MDAYEDSERPHRCIVRIYEAYLSHRPPAAPEHLYLRPLSRISGGVWFSCQPIGINTLSKTVARLCTSAGVTGFRTNHSLRATAATRLYHAKVDEQQIAETTGHRSTAIRRYKRTTDDQRKETSNIIAGCHRESVDPSPTQCPADYRSENRSSASSSAAAAAPAATTRGAAAAAAGSSSASSCLVFNAKNFDLTINF